MESKDTRPCRTVKFGRAGLLALVSLTAFALIAACGAGPVGEPDAFDPELPVKAANVEAKSEALTAPATLCDPSTSCDNCNVDTQVGHILFVHGYSSDQGAFGTWYNWIKPQNDCAGYKTYRVSIGQKGGQHLHDACYPWNCEYGYDQISCTPNAYEPKCIGWCNSTYSNGDCKGYDRTKNGTCGSNGFCVTYSDDGATKHINVWSDDLASFFWNNKLTDLPDHSVTIVTHSTGAPAVADFMVRGYDGEATHAVPARKVKRVINIQAALGGACGVSVAFNYDDAISDLDDLQDDDLNYDFRKATFDGQVPWTHAQSFGSNGTECEGMNVPIASTGDYCDGKAHDGVTNNWHDNTSVEHPNGAGNQAGTYPYSITVLQPDQGFCHVGGDSFPSYRSDRGRFEYILGSPARGIGEVANPEKYSAWLGLLTTAPEWLD